MAGRESWVERQQRLVRCKIHGLHYDPKLTSGCIICRKQEQPKRRSPQLAIMLLLLLGIVFVFLQLLTPWLKQPSAETGPAIAEIEAQSAETQAPGRPPRLEPQPFRGAIEALEGALFRPQTPDLSEIDDQVAAAGSRLSEELQRGGGDMGLAAAASIDSLLERWQTSLGTLQDVEKARSQWIESRDRFFEEAPWYSHLSSDVGRVERVTLLAYREVAAEAEALIADGLAQIQAERDDAGPFAETPADRETRLAARRQWWG
ncbi:MAG: hypothetical protein HC897_01725, partial [Thermoanaerobaculia bacterium]|nr:hypothetical protein [Thermoanaerobaculia bacterium]